MKNSTGNAIIRLMMNTLMGTTTTIPTSSLPSDYTAQKLIFVVLMKAANIF